MVPVHLAVTVEGEGFEALLANLRDRITANRIFIHTDRPIALKTPVRIEVSYDSGVTALRGGGSVADVRRMGVWVAVEWEAECRDLVDRILYNHVNEASTTEDGHNWADALFSGGADVIAPNFVPEEVEIEDEVFKESSASSWLQPDVDVDIDIDLPELSDNGIAVSPFDEPMEVAEEISFDTADVPMFEVSPEEQGESLAEDFQKLIDETITEVEEADAIVRGKKRAPDPETDEIRPDVEIEMAASLADDLALPEPNTLTDAFNRPPEPILQQQALPARELPPKGNVIIGIDLGTTYSCAAIVEKGEPRVLATHRGKPTVPSVVYYDRGGKTIIGDAALKKGETDAKRTIVGSKRLMGRPFHSPIVQEVREHFAYQIVQGASGEAAIRMDDRIVALEEVAAEILRDLREAAALQIDGRINRAVITCPAYFNERQREAVRVAGELAGFHVERVLNEPTAAALHYGYGKGFDGRKLLVYDLGGGTFDVSLMEVTGQVYEVLATGGDSFLGGIDFDACVAEMLASAFLEQEHIDPRSDPSAVARLLHYAEKAKRELSTQVSTIVQIDHLVVQPYAARNVTLTMRQTRAEQAFEPLVARTLKVVEEVCARAGVRLDQVHDILLVGGQTRTPLVRRKVAELFGKQPLSSVHPDFAVALGAAQYAASLGTIDDIILIDALPISIGVGLPGGRFKRIIERDTRLPVKRKYELHTTRDNQKSFEILVFQGEDDWVQQNEPLGMLIVPNLPKGPRGAVSVDVELEVNEECILKLVAREKKTGKVVQAQFGTKDTPEELRTKLELPPKPSHSELQRMKEEANRPKNVWRWLTGLFGGR